MNDFMRFSFLGMFAIAMAGIAFFLLANLLWLRIREKRERQSNEHYWKQRLHGNR